MQNKNSCKRLKDRVEKDIPNAEEHYRTIGKDSVKSSRRTESV